MRETEYTAIAYGCPCDDPCSSYRRCRDELLACESYHAWANSKRRGRVTKREPDRRWYLLLEGDA